MEHGLTSLVDASTCGLSRFFDIHFYKLPTQIHCEACNVVHMLVKCISQMLVRTSISQYINNMIIS